MASCQVFCALQDTQSTADTQIHPQRQRSGSLRPLTHPIPKVGTTAEAGLPCAACIQELLSHVPSADCKRWVIPPPQQCVHCKGVLAF